MQTEVTLLQQFKTEPWLLIFNKNHWVVTLSLVLVTGICWLYLWQMAVSMGEFSGHSENMMPMIYAWTLIDFFLMFLMWAVMMVGMMVPSAAPMILAYESIGRQQPQYRHTLSFSLGYVTMWTSFSLVATLLQWGLESAALLSPMLVNQSPWFGALILVAAGLYQFSPLKNRCLTQCRSPFQFIVIIK